MVQRDIYMFLSTLYLEYVGKNLHIYKKSILTSSTLMVFFFYFYCSFLSYYMCFIHMLIFAKKIHPFSELFFNWPWPYLPLFINKDLLFFHWWTWLDFLFISCKVCKLCFCCFNSSEHSRNCIYIITCSHTVSS